MKTFRKRQAKKGQLNSMLVMIVFLFIMIFMIIFGKTIFLEFQDAAQGTVLETVPESNATMNQFTDTTFQGMNNMYMILFFGMFVFITVFAFFARTHPLFFPIAAFVVLPFMIFLAAIFSNVYFELTLQDEVSEAVGNSTMPDHIMGRMPWYVFGYGVIALIVLYGINRSEGL